ncbi:46_t:CDS:10, partial [Diversispora eburnea]
MENFCNKENNAVASWFLGPRAENCYFFREFLEEITDKQVEARRDKYYPKDPYFITNEIRDSVEYNSSMEYLREVLAELSNKLVKKTIPFWSPRYMGHMSMESTMAGNLGYVAALLYNQNNCSIEGSPLTTLLEIFVGKQLCEMLGFNVYWHENENIYNIEKLDYISTELHEIQGWGHITCDGSVANLESIWAGKNLNTRNLKFYPLSLRLAFNDNGPLSFIGSSFKVELANSKEKLLKECSTWELLNLKPTTVLDIPDQLYSEYGITPQFLQGSLKEYTIQTVGKDYLERKFNITEPSVYFASTTMHYSWPKGCAIVGIGSKNLLSVPVDNAARMDVKKLDKLLLECVNKKQAVYAVVAIMGSTEHGACDPLDDIVKLREKYERNYGLSFVIHADAAWGGYFRSILVKPPPGPDYTRRRKGLEQERDSFIPLLALNPYTKKHLDSLKHSDSITIDPHKSGYIPYPAGGLCYRDQRMRYLNTWTSPVVFRTNELSIGVYGVEGSKPGAAPVAAWLSHEIIGLHQKGYGLLLGQVNFSCSKIYCHWATMSTEEDDFIVVPLIMLPAEKCSPPNPEKVEKQKRDIRKLIVGKSNSEIINNEDAIKLIKDLGTNEDKPLILTSSQLNKKNYQGCLSNFKNRLGLKGDQDLYVLINVVTSPWVTEFDFISELTKTFKETLRDSVKVSIKRNKVEPHFYAFVIQGIDKLYLTHLPMFQMKNHRQQVIITADLPEDIKHQYLKARKTNPSHVYFLGNQDMMKLDDIACDGSSFRGVIYRDFDLKTKKPTVLINDFQVTNVRVLKKRHLATRFQDANYPKGHMPFYIYGTEQELHIDHMLLKFPSIQLSADRVKLDLTSGELTSTQRKNGVIVHITDVNEVAMQPFQEIQANQKSRTFHVELYEDPMPNSDQNGSGLDNVKEPFAKGTITLQSRSLYIDSYLINEDPTTDERDKNKFVKRSQSQTEPISFVHVNRPRWYEEK